MAKSPIIKAAITEREVPKELGVFKEANFNPSTANSSRINCKNTGIA